MDNIRERFWDINGVLILLVYSTKNKRYSLFVNNEYFKDISQATGDALIQLLDKIEELMSGDIDG